jgi:nucleoside-diphosphate-sugar epimerase
LKTDGKILVTGATGFIGGRIVEVLHLSKFKDVRATIHQWSTAARLGRFPVEIVEMDLLDQEQVDKALDGITHVIHCAKGPEEVTVGGTRNLLEASLTKEIKHFIHLSTAEVYGKVLGEIDESFPLTYSGNDYNKMKVDAEKECWEYAKKGLPVTIFRPSIVYGPFSTYWTTRYIKMMIAGKWGIYERYGDGKANLIFVDELVFAALHALDKEKAFAQAFNVNGPQVASWNEYFQSLNDKLGLQPLKKIKVSQANLKTTLMQPVRFAGEIVRDHFLEPVKKIADTFAFAKRLMKQTEHALKTTPAKEDFELYQRDVFYNASKVGRILGWHPTFSIDQGIQVSVDWAKQQGFFR